VQASSRRATALSPPCRGLSNCAHHVTWGSVCLILLANSGQAKWCRRRSGMTQNSRGRLEMRSALRLLNTTRSYIALPSLSFNGSISGSSSGRSFAHEGRTLCDGAEGGRYSTVRPWWVVGGSPFSGYRSVGDSVGTHDVGAASACCGKPRKLGKLYARRDMWIVVKWETQETLGLF
jgi:hypothetical protein